MLSWWFQAWDVAINTINYEIKSVVSISENFDFRYSGRNGSIAVKFTADVDARAL